MQHVGEPDADRRLKLDLRSVQADWSAEQRLVARQPLRRPRQAMAVDVEKRQLFEPCRIGAVDKEAGANAGLEMARREIVAIEPENPLRRATPGEAVGQAVDQPVVEGEHERRVDRVRRRDRRCVRCPDIPLLARPDMVNGMTSSSRAKKGAASGALEMEVA